MNMLFRIGQFLRFYLGAVTRYQLHSPFVFELAEALLDERRWYYAFRDIEQVRKKMRETSIRFPFRDLGTGNDREVALRELAGRTSSSPRQGRMLFRLANWLNPKSMLELGASVGIGAMYLAAGARNARLVSIEGDGNAARIARANLELLQLDKNAAVLEGSFEQQLPAALRTLSSPDLVFFDGDHRLEPTWSYVEQCLAAAHAQTVLVFDDVHGSPGMQEAWKRVQQHARVTLTIDFFDLSLAFVNPDFKQKQHYRIVPSRWKIWKFM